MAATTTTKDEPQLNGGTTLGQIPPVNDTAGGVAPQAFIEACRFLFQRAANDHSWLFHS